MMHLALAYDGVKSDRPLTYRYLFYRWRKNMKVGYIDPAIVPPEVIASDMEYAEIEADMRAKKEQSKNA